MRPPSTTSLRRRSLGATCRRTFSSRSARTRSPKLDRFDHLLPNLLANLIRVEPLDFEDARNVIESAVNQWSSDHGEKIAIQDGLIENVLRDVQTDRVFIGESGRGVTEAEEESGSGSIEAPYLQLVMTRLWEEERRGKSSTPAPRHARDARRRPVDHRDAPRPDDGPALEGRSRRRGACLSLPRYSLGDEDRAFVGRPRQVRGRRRGDVDPGAGAARGAGRAGAENRQPAATRRAGALRDLPRRARRGRARLAVAVHPLAGRAPRDRVRVRAGRAVRAADHPVCLHLRGRRSEFRGTSLVVRRGPPPHSSGGR